MITRCPHCQSVFRLADAQIKTAKGRVRCGECHQVFDATKNSVPPEQAKKSDAKTGRIPPPPPVHAGPQEDPSAPPPGKARKSAASLSEDEIAALLEADLAEHGGPSWGSLFAWMLIALLLAVTLAGQYLWWYQRDVVLQHPQARPWLVQACNWLDCELPVLRKPELVQVGQRVLERHPDAPNASIVRVNFDNRAVFPQPYPQLELRIHNEQGRLIAARRFSPREYLYDATADQQLMRPGEPVSVKLELQDSVEKMYTYGFTIAFL